MGQTLTHGVYLPDEGERNCYSGLAANWQILDTSVGTIAAHTAALAGKAPAVHTHTKSDITDFPAYGNTAGTICEGNDSRLSDARTPVAHTHTKSDVTNLLNSNFIPAANNSYNLGSSSYQWNNLYANRYFLTSASAELGITGGFSTIKFQDKNNKNLAGITLGHYSAGKLSYNRVSIYDKDSNNQELEEFVELAFLVNNQVFYFRPSTDNKAYLGTSGKKWKDLCTNLINGVNPGALSLPDMSSGTGVSLSAGSNSYSPPSSGWLSINLTGAISVVCGNFCHSGTDMLSVPVVKGSTYTVTVATSGTAYLFVSQGNV